MIYDTSSSSYGYYEKKVKKRIILLTSVESDSIFKLISDSKKNDYDIIAFNINKKEKNNIIKIIKTSTSLRKSDILVASNLNGYYLYHASSNMKNKMILINPILVDKKGNEILPSDELKKGKDGKPIIIISENNPNLKSLKKVLKGHEPIITGNIFEGFNELI